MTAANTFRVTYAPLSGNNLVPQNTLDARPSPREPGPHTLPRKKLIWLLLLLSLTGCSHRPPFKEFKDTKAGYRVLLPGTPSEDLDHLEFAGKTLDIKSEKVEEGGDAYMVTFLELPPGFTLDSTKSLDGAVDGMLKKSKGKLVEAYSVDAETRHPSRQVKLEIPGGQLIEGRILVLPPPLAEPGTLGPGATDVDYARSRKMVGTAKIYQVMVTHKKLKKSVVQRYLRSFKLLADEL